MAKRTTSRSQPEDTAAEAAPQSKPRRSRSTSSHAPAAPDAAAPPSNPGEDRTVDRDAAGEGGEAEWSSPAVEPSEEEIRLRAYHRYLERGGGHGMDFEDWLEAERELRQSQVSSPKSRVES